MKRILTFLGVVVLLALPVVALAQAAPTSTSAAPVTFVSDPIGYLQAHYEAIYAALFSVFIIARVVIRYVTVPKSGTLWAALYNFIAFSGFTLLHLRTERYGQAPTMQHGSCQLMGCKPRPGDAPTSFPKEDQWSFS